eukprot:3214498-Pyramimonas_sp.AAC.1
MELRQKREHTCELLNELKRKLEEEDEEYLMDDEDDMRSRKMDEYESGPRRMNVASGSGCMTGSQRMGHGNYGEGQSVEVLAMINQMKTLTDM